MNTYNIRPPHKPISIVTAHEKIEPGGALFMALKHGSELTKAKSLGIFSIVTSDDQALEKIKTLGIEITDDFIEKIVVFRVRDLGKLKAITSFFAYKISSNLRSNIEKSGSEIVHLHKIHFAQIPILKALRGYRVYHTAHDFGILCPLTAAVRVSDSQACSLAAGVHCSRNCRVNLLSAAFYWIRQRIMFAHFKALKISVIAPSEALKKYLEKSAPVKLSHFHVRNPVDRQMRVNNLEIIERKLNAYRSRLISVIYAGSLSTNKGAHLLPAIFAAIHGSFKEIGIEAEFSIFGEGPLQQVISEKFSEDVLKIKCSLNSFVPQSQLLQVYQKSAIAVVPSMGQENQSGVLMEAAVNGCLVVTTPLGGNCENFKDEFGCLWSNKNVSTFILRAFQSEDHYEKSISAALQFASKQLSWKDYIHRLEKVYSIN